MGCKIAELERSRVEHARLVNRVNNDWADAGEQCCCKALDGVLPQDDKAQLRPPILSAPVPPRPNSILVAHSLSQGFQQFVAFFCNASCSWVSAQTCAGSGNRAPALCMLAEGTRYHERLVASPGVAVNPSRSAADVCDPSPLALMFMASSNRRSLESYIGCCHRA
jgi:hypothetical protein